MNNAFYAICLSASFVAFSIKCLQTVQRIRRQDLNMYWGSGSSLSSFIAHTMVLVWGTLAFINFGATVMITSEESKNSTSPEISLSVPPATERKNSLLTPDPGRESTPEELRQLEAKTQYSGDDEIVRKRLGLPPKSHQENGSLTDRQSALSPTLGINSDNPEPQTQEKTPSSE